MEDRLSAWRRLAEQEARRWIRRGFASALLEDCVQEGLYAIWTHVSASGGTDAPLLRTVARRRILNFLKAARTRAYAYTTHSRKSGPQTRSRARGFLLSGEVGFADGESEDEPGDPVLTVNPWPEVETAIAARQALARYGRASGASLVFTGSRQARGQKSARCVKWLLANPRPFDQESLVPPTPAVA